MLGAPFPCGPAFEFMLARRVGVLRASRADASVLVRAWLPVDSHQTYSIPYMINYVHDFAI